MPIFSDSDIDDLSDLVAELVYDDRYYLLREVVAFDEEHNRISTWAEVESGWGSLQSRDLTTAETLLADRPTPTGQYSFKCPKGSIVDDDDRMRVGAQTFTVVGITALARMSLSKIVQLQEAVDE